MNSNSSNENIPSVSLSRLGILTFRIRGLGPVPSFKNSKCIFRRRDQKRTPFIATNPKSKQWMERAIKLIASQLYSMCETNESEITPECLRRFVTSSLPHDDCWQALEIGSVQTVLVDRDDEVGANIVIERLTPEISAQEAAVGYAKAYEEVCRG